MLHIYVGCKPLKSIVIRNCTSQASDGPAPLLSGVYVRVCSFFQGVGQGKRGRFMSQKAVVHNGPGNQSGLIVKSLHFENKIVFLQYML